MQKFLDILKALLASPGGSNPFFAPLIVAPIVGILRSLSAQLATLADQAEKDPAGFIKALEDFLKSLGVNPQ